MIPEHVYDVRGNKQEEVEVQQDEQEDVEVQQEEVVGNRSAFLTEVEEDVEEEVEEQEVE